MDTHDAKTLYARAQELYRSGQSDEALDLLTPLARQFPDDQNLSFARARCLAKLGRADEARAICRDLVARSGHPQAQELLAQLDGEPVLDPALSGLADILDSPIAGARASAANYELSTKDKLVAFLMTRSVVIVLVGLAVIVGVYLWQLKLLGGRDWGSADLDAVQMNGPADSQSGN